MYKAVIFDLDGTTVDSEIAIQHSANQSLREHNLRELPVEMYKRFAGDGQYELIKRVVRAAGDEELTCYESVMARYIELFKEGCDYQVAPCKGMKEAIEVIKKKGLKVAILTNKAHDNGVKVIDTAYGAGFFDYVLGQKDTHKKKPSPEGAVIVAKELGVECEECLYVGDTAVDINTGKAAGMDTVAVTWGFRTRKELEKENPKYMIDRAEQLLELIE